MLSDGSGLTARQCATLLDTAGHHVEALSPRGLNLCRFTRHVRRVHEVPSYGVDPFGWLDAAISLCQSRRCDVLLATQEQVAVLSLARDRLVSEHVATVVPKFGALAAVFDKVSAAATLTRLGLPQPPMATRTEGWERYPAFVKDPIGTASSGVQRVTTPEELHAAAAGRTVLIQAAADGALAMCQSVFDQGRLVAFHACVRSGEGAKGGASHKVGVVLPDARRHLEVLGADLAWHGALSADMIIGSDGPTFIDINPRLVEPVNASRSGVDLVGPMLEMAAGGHPVAQSGGREGVSSHQLLVGVLGAAQNGEGRRGVISELVDAGRHRGRYRTSAEELTPLAGDPLAVVPVALASLATLVRPKTWSWFASGSVSRYALTPSGWRRIVEQAGTAPL